MKLCNIIVDGSGHVAVVTDRGIVDATASGLDFSIDEIIAGNGIDEIARIAVDVTLPVLQENEVTFGRILNNPDKIVCVGLNYSEHANNCGEKPFETPTLFSKFSDSLSAANSDVVLPKHENSFDYEAELVIVIGRRARSVSVDQAHDYIFGYASGNDLSCRAAQLRTTQWLIGKALPDFAPCGPYVVTADEYDPSEPKYVRSWVNGELKQNGLTSHMVFNCEELVSYASMYINLNPGDLIFTGTPSGVIIEKKREDRVWLRAGDVVEVEVEGLGKLRNRLV